MFTLILRARRSVFHNKRRVRRLRILIGRTSAINGNVLKQASGRFLPLSGSLAFVKRVGTKGRIRRNNFTTTILARGKWGLPSIDPRISVFINGGATGNFNSVFRLGNRFAFRILFRLHRDPSFFLRHGGGLFRCALGPRGFRCGTAGGCRLWYVYWGSIGRWRRGFRPGCNVVDLLRPLADGKEGFS